MTIFAYTQKHVYMYNCTPQNQQISLTFITPKVTNSTK